MQFQIELGDDGQYASRGVGTVIVERESGIPLHLNDVLYVPGLKKNLVSVATLKNKGYDGIFNRDKAYLKHLTSSAVKQIGVRVKNLYGLQVERCAALNSKAGGKQSRDIGKLWHRCMGHLHHGVLKILQQIATGLPACSFDQHDVCKGCTLGKYAKTSFQGQDSKAKGILELVHSDVCRPFSSPSLMRHKYYATLIDDYSYKTWIVFMKKKDEVFSKFMEYKALVENQTRKKIKALRSDNRREYVPYAFKDLYEKDGIRRELIAPHNPQQNGVAERKNCSIVGAAKAMLHDQALPMFL